MMTDEDIQKELSKMKKIQEETFATMENTIKTQQESIDIQNEIIKSQENIISMLEGRTVWDRILNVFIP